MIKSLAFEDQESAYAKLNLALHVRKRLPNGYHELETVFAFVDQGDEISVKSSDDLTLTISGPFASGLANHDNLIIEAAQLLREKYGVRQGADIHLEKNLPIASGIGGGSADAAATLRLLNRFWKLNLADDALKDMSKPLGADVPACISSEASFGHGIGQDLQSLESNDLSGKYVLLANSLISVSTPQIFEKWDNIDRGPLKFGQTSEALRNGRNDLQPIAIALESSIAPILSALGKTKPIMAKMSGSGATCFGVYDTIEKVEAAKDMVETSFDKVWTMTGQIR